MVKKKSAEKSVVGRVGSLLEWRKYDKIVWDDVVPDGVGTFVRNLKGMLSDGGELWVSEGVNRAIAGAIRVEFGNSVREEEGYFVYKAS